MAYPLNHHNTDCTGFQNPNQCDPGLFDGDGRDPNHATAPIFFPENSYQAALNYEASFLLDTSLSNLSFQHASSAPFPGLVHTDNSYFEVPISFPFSHLALPASERPQPVPSFQPSTLVVSAPIRAFVSQASGRRYFECPMCPQKFGRIARANACLNGHFQRKPYACDKTCGDSNCEKAYGSIELLRRHKNSRQTSCPACKRNFLRQNIARHKAVCNKRSSRK